MDERINPIWVTTKPIWLTTHPPKKIREYLIERGILTYPLNIYQEEE